MNFDIIRPLFGGKLMQSQVDGINAVVDEWHKDATNSDIRQLAYILATIFHESNQKMQPIEEAGYLPRKIQMAYLQGKEYWPYYGRGIVQITWKENYQKFGSVLNVDLVNNPNLALDMKNSLNITFLGMKTGLFTAKKMGKGKKLSDYFNEIKEDAINARRIINGLDKAELITGYYTLFKKALNKS